MHDLSGRLQGMHSVLINLSYRITLHLLVTDREIVPLNVDDNALRLAVNGVAEVHERRP